MKSRRVTHTQISRIDLEDQYRAIAEQQMLTVQVFSDGPLDATTALIGEYPGETEQRKGLPFVGNSGAFMWKSLSKIGVERAKVYSTNVMKRQVQIPREETSSKTQVPRSEFLAWKDLLLWELSNLPKLTSVVCLGGAAMEAMTGNVGITNWRGSIIPTHLPNGNDGHVVCTYNPAYPLRVPSEELSWLLDVQKISKVLTGRFTPYVIDTVINPTYKEAMAYLRDLKRSKEPIAWDVEVINGETACHGFSNDPHKAISINLRDMETNRYLLGQEADILCAIQDLCESHRIIAQNGNFDSYHCWLRDRLQIPIWFDTLLAHHTMYPQLPHNLGYLTTQYTDHPYYKDEGWLWQEGESALTGGNIDTFWHYNGKDAAVTKSVQIKEERELERQGLSNFFFHHVMRAQPHLVAATVHGVAVDLSVKERIKAQCETDLQSLYERFQFYVQECVRDLDYEPNPDSWQQLKELFFERLNLRGRGTSTDKTNRDYILKDRRTSPMEKELITALNAYKTEAKFVGTYANAKVSEDGRFRCEYKQYGVTNAPGRLSSAALLSGEGGNMQNQPVRARGMYVADPDTVLLYFDLAQAEAQVVSFRADIPVWKQQFARAKKDGSYDCHRALASEMYKVPYETVPVKDWDEDGKPTQRYVSKRCRHGLNYEMKETRLAEVTQLPFHQARHAFQLYHKSTPQLREWWAEQKYQFEKTREIYNALGRRFKVFQRIDEDVMEPVVAFYAQSTIGDKITQVWYQCEEDDAWPTPENARICIDVHDNLVALAVPKVAKTCMKIMKKYAESPIWIQDVYNRRKPEPLSIPAELKMSYPSSWDEKTKRFVKDPKGLHRWSNMEVVKL